MGFHPLRRHWLIKLMFALVAAMDAVFGAVMWTRLRDLSRHIRRRYYQRLFQLYRIPIPAGGDIIQGGVVIEDGIPRPVDPFAKVRIVLSSATIQAAINAAAAGDIIYIQPGDYDEALSITKDNLTLVGLGARGAVAVAPSAANGIAILIDGTGAGGRVEEVTLVNIGGEGNGTGGGLHVKGNVRRFRAYGCKFEGGEFGVKLESTGADPLTVGDTRFEDCEFAWTNTGLHLSVTGAGDPVTQTSLRHCLFHDCATEWILSNGAYTTGLWVKDCVFAKEEDASAPVAGQLDVAVAGSEGIFAGNAFDLATMAIATLVIADGIRWVGNTTEAGVGGRPG